MQHNNRPSARSQEEIHLDELSSDFRIVDVNIKNVCEIAGQNCWLETISINGVNVVFKFDTGAEINLIPLDMLNKCKPKPFVDENCSLNLIVGLG